MKHTFLHKEEGYRRLILIFGGWACDERAYTGVRAKGWDVLLCHEYDDMDFDRALLSGYRTIYLYAWSLGVFVANRCLQGVRLARAVAINGTLQPVDDRCGIPAAIYRGTAERLDQRNLLKFGRRMFGSQEEFERYREMFESREDMDALRSQLYLIAEEQDCSEVEPIPWTDVVVSRNDMIFPYDNQMSAWEGHKNVRQVEDAHFVNISELVRSTIIDTDRVAKLFQRSRQTYDDNAEVQEHVIRSLILELAVHVACNHVALDSVLEVGYGSGMLTKDYCKYWQSYIKEVTLVDLCPPPATPFGAAPKENYIQADAEQWIANLPEDVKFDAIFSTSAMQWFADPYLFLKQCALHLKPGGIMGLTTFGPNNLWQLNYARQSPLLYRTQDELREMAQEFFAEVKVYSCMTNLHFKTPADLLQHLKATGVTGGTSSSIARIRFLLSTMHPDDWGEYKLTYDPIFIYAMHNGTF